MANFLKLARLITELTCEKISEYLHRDMLWEKVIPARLDRYAKVCQTS